jgi:hypothetical protein
MAQLARGLVSLLGSIDRGRSMNVHNGTIKIETCVFRAQAIITNISVHVYGSLKAQVPLGKLLRSISLGACSIKKQLTRRCDWS